MARNPGLLKKAVNFVRNDVRRTEANYRRFEREQDKLKAGRQPPGMIKTAVLSPVVMVRESYRDARAYTQKVRDLVTPKPAAKKPSPKEPIQKKSIYDRLATRHNKPVFSKPGPT